MSCFNGYCMTIGIYVENHEKHVHILMISNLLTFSLEHTILHITILIRIMPTCYS